MNILHKNQFFGNQQIFRCNLASNGGERPGRAVMPGFHAKYRLKGLIIRLITFSGAGIPAVLNSVRTGGRYHPDGYKQDSSPCLSEPSVAELRSSSPDSTKPPLNIKIKFFLGYEICPVCGSNDIIIRGFEGVNQRYHCQCCGIETVVLC